jgi:hypothetical protein
MKKLNFIVFVAFTIVALVASPQARAAQITGTIGFTSAPHLTGGHVAQGGGTTTVTFNNPLHVDFGTDDYFTTPGSAVNFNPISWTGSGGSAVLTSSNSPEWSFNIGLITYSFDLTQLTSASFGPGNPNALSLSGEGLAKITGFENTFATFSLQGTGKGLTFTIIQASNTAVPSVPDTGSALALLGLGLVVLEGLRRKLASAERVLVQSNSKTTP